MNALQDAIAAERDAAARHQACCLEVWKALQVSRPVLADRIRTLFADDTLAAQWLCGRRRGTPSPAELVAAGNDAQVEQRLLQAMHGMGG